MRILFDSRDVKFKSPFGTLVQGETCTLHLHIPCSVGSTKAECIISPDDGGSDTICILEKNSTQGGYDIFRGSFVLDTAGLYFYRFHIYKKDGDFRLFKAGYGTNMEAGDLWQLTCAPVDFVTPDWAKGAIIYQVFPDRFCKVGNPDLTGKLEPYTIHEDWYEDVQWQPDEQGNIQNNDFFGGNFQGIASKMDHIADLGATVLYLNPISKSYSNHRYDTADYKVPDPMLGTLDDFKNMCDAAHKRGIQVILDGVFSHTGSRSIYFESACSCPDSPYYSWYTFYAYPHKYNCWWGFETLPTGNKSDPAFMDYAASVVEHWLGLGADGFRLDVADELPDFFILRLKQQMRKIKPDALLIGEVWEDASNKIAYEVRRRYFVDGELDSCMNYPFRTAILDFVKGIDGGQLFQERVMAIAENYPPQVLACNMNLLSSHDTPRILTALVDDLEGSREEYANRKLSHNQRERAKKLLKLSAFLQYTLPGSPSIYYGDEVGLEGHKDPFNRRTYPWGKEDSELLAFFKGLGRLRKNNEILRLGDVCFFYAEGGKLGFSRSYKNKKIKIYINRSNAPWDIPPKKVLYANNLADTLLPMGYCIMEEEGWRKNIF